MASNRLYIVNPETGNTLCIAKSWGEGWKTWHDSPAMLEQDLERFFDGADLGASSGNISQMLPTRLCLTTENEGMVRGESQK